MSVSADLASIEIYGRNLIIIAPLAHLEYTPGHLPQAREAGLARCGGSGTPRGPTYSILNTTLYMQCSREYTPLFALAHDTMYGNLKRKYYREEKKLVTYIYSSLCNTLYNTQHLL